MYLGFLISNFFEDTTPWSLTRMNIGITGLLMYRLHRVSTENK